MSLFEVIGLAGVAAAAGAINAVAGGGTILTFPALLAFGTPPLMANATSTLALFLGTAGSVVGFRRHLATVRPWLWRFVPASVLGGLLGSILLTRTSERVFSRLIPFLILFATLLFLGQGILRRWMKPGAGRPSPEPARSYVGAVAFQFAVALYGGYFGAGIGILMLAALALIGFTDIHEMNTLKTVLSALINLVAALWFVGAGLIHWPKAGIMTAGALLGYYLGSHYSQRISQTAVRAIITAVGLLISAFTFYKEFLR